MAGSNRTLDGRFVDVFRKTTGRWRRQRLWWLVIRKNIFAIIHAAIYRLLMRVRDVIVVTWRRQLYVNTHKHDKIHVSLSVQYAMKQFWYKPKSDRQRIAKCPQNNTRRVAVYLETHCNIGSKRAFPTGVLDRWHNCLLIYWCTSCLVSALRRREGGALVIHKIIYLTEETVTLKRRRWRSWTCCTETHKNQSVQLSSAIFRVA